MGHRMNRGELRKAEKARKARALVKKRERLSQRPGIDPQVVMRLHQLVASRQARIVLATVNEDAPSICVMYEKHGIDIHTVAPADEGRALLRERALKHVSAREWDVFVDHHRLKCREIPHSGAVVVSSIGWREEGELLADPESFDQNDGWEVLRGGQVIGQAVIQERTITLAGGALYRVEHAGASRVADGEGGADASGGFSGILVAVSQRAGMVALSNVDDVRLACMQEIVEVNRGAGSVLVISTVNH